MRIACSLFVALSFAETLTVSSHYHNKPYIVEPMVPQYAIKGRYITLPKTTANFVDSTGVYNTDVKITVNGVDYTDKEYLVTGDFTVKYTATNTDNKVMYATFGGHPGFNVPLDNGSSEDYYLEFSEKCEPREIIFSDGSTVPFPIRDNQFIDLKHSLFDNDSIFMVNAADAMTLKSKISERSVTISYPGAKYMGIWHTPKSDAPFVCLEPWWGSPARAGGYADLETMQDLYAFQPGDTKSVAYDIIIK